MGSCCQSQKNKRSKKAAICCGWGSNPGLLCARGCLGCANHLGWLGCVDKYRFVLDLTHYVELTWVSPGMARWRWYCGSAVGCRGLWWSSGRGRDGTACGRGWRSRGKVRWGPCLSVVVGRGDRSCSKRRRTRLCLLRSVHCEKNSKKDVRRCAWS